jgi:hypothetical protein
VVPNVPIASEELVGIPLDLVTNNEKRKTYPSGVRKKRRLGVGDCERRLGIGDYERKVVGSEVSDLNEGDA